MKIVNLHFLQRRVKLDGIAYIIKLYSKKIKIKKVFCSYESVRNSLKISSCNKSTLKKK